MFIENQSLGIAEGGEDRLREAIEQQLRREHEEALSATTDYWQKVAIEKKIEDEVEKRMKQVASPYSLWSSL